MALPLEPKSNPNSELRRGVALLFLSEVGPPATPTAASPLLRTARGATPASPTGGGGAGQAERQRWVAAAQGGRREGSAPTPAAPTAAAAAARTEGRLAAGGRGAAMADGD